ncbi:hypothetical protein HZH68_010662 [Vespula germanica]|uniref:Uncharacterized protein n=2 Tax=Vespula TaxID=7451 RepID=A0A834N4B8_VESGE|nr:hypothetical protein HZH68_010662 [Vespula germanica]
MLMTLVALAVLPHSPILYRFVVSSVNRQVRSKDCKVMGRPEKTTRSPPFATAFARSEHALVVGRHRRRRRRQRDYDDDDEEEEEEENDDSDALSISRVALEDRESEEFVCLLVSSAASKRQADLRSRTNDFAFRATGGWLLPNVGILCQRKKLLSVKRSSNSNSSRMDFDDFKASRERKRSGGAEAEAEAGTSYLVLSWYMRKSRSLASPKGDKSNKPPSHRQKDQIELSSRWYPHAERSKNDAGVNQSAVICILREWATKRPGPAGDDIEVAVRVCVQACARTDESVAAEFKQVFALNETLSMQMIGARENGTRHHETRAVPLVRKTTMAMMHGRDIGSDQNISQSQSPYPYYQPPASILVTRYGLTATGSERLSEHAISGRTRIPKVKDLVRETESTTFPFRRVNST